MVYHIERHLVHKDVSPEIDLPEFELKSPEVTVTVYATDVNATAEIYRQEAGGDMQLIQLPLTVLEKLVEKLKEMNP